MKILFNEHPNKGFQRVGYCSYYGEIFYALEEVCEVTSSCGCQVEQVNLVVDMMRL